MCGIIIQTGHGHNRNKVIECGLKAMKHRGESETVYDSNYYSVGHRRLAITDINGQGHPYEVGKALIWNVGEYYDYQKAPDTIDLLKNINNHPPGMYSAVVALKKSNVLSIHIDQLSKKPLYYRADTGTVASEIKALTTSALPDVHINQGYFKSVSEGLLPFSYETAYKSIFRLKPGTYHFDTKLGMFNYTSFPNLDNTPERLRIQEAVLKRVPTEVPFITLLSGGLDSSLIYHIIKGINVDPHPVHYQQKDDPLGTTMAKTIAPNVTILKEPEEEPYLTELLYINESPLDLGSMIPQFNLFRSIRQQSPDTKVVITGDGADELFWGYRRALKGDTRSYDLSELQAWHIPRLDKFGMWFGLEVRCPYLDDAVYNYSKNLIWDADKGKLPIKKVANDLGLYPPIVSRPKHPLKSNRFKKREGHKQELVSLFLQHFSKGLRL